MACNCTKSNKTKTPSYTVVYSNGKTYKTYSSEIEAKAAATRIGGKIK